MNNRDYKNFAPDEIYHIYNRGVGKIDIFKDNEDLKVFLFRLKENLFPNDKNNADLKKYRRKPLQPNSFKLISYCLMPNHFHFLIRQEKEIPIGKLISKLCTSYSKYFNKKYERVGSLFQDQFKAVLIENNEQLLWTSFYIHENPRKAYIVKNLDQYKWSSFLDYKGLSKESLCSKDLILGQFNHPKSYINYFEDLNLSEKIENKMIGWQDLCLD